MKISTLLAGTALALALSTGAAHADCAWLRGQDRYAWCVQREAEDAANVARAMANHTGAYAEHTRPPPPRLGGCDWPHLDFATGGIATENPAWCLEQQEFVAIARTLPPAEQRILKGKVVLARSGCPVHWSLGDKTARMFENPPGCEVSPALHRWLEEAPPPLYTPR
jgi:hypothetical protein